MGNFKSLSVWLLFYIQITAKPSSATCGGKIERTATVTYSVLADGSGTEEYANNLDCSWLLQAPTGSNLRLTFTSFSLEKKDTVTGKCYDYVEIMDGMDSSQSSLGRYCGMLDGRISQPFLSTESSMLLKFHTDKGTSAQGFVAQYRAEAKPSREPKIFASNNTDLHLVAEGKILLTGEVVVGNNIPLLSTLQLVSESIAKYENQSANCDITGILKRIEQLENRVEVFTVASGQSSNTSTSHLKCLNNCSGNGVCTHQYNSTVAEWLPACACKPGYIRPTCSSRVQRLEGDQRDGVKTIAKLETFSTCAAIAGSAHTGSTIIVINYAISWLKNEDEIMVIQMQGQNAGQYEFTRVQKVTRSIIYLIHPLVHTYSSSSNARAQIVRVPNYSKFTITGNGKLTALNWNGTSGGIIAIRARTFTIDLGGTIDTNGKGFRGGPEKKCCYYWIGVTGESWKEIGFPNNYQTSNNAGGGGSSYCQCREIAGSGSYGSVGLPPLGKSCSGSGHGQPGAIYGSPNLTQLFLGSGGGGGCDSSTTSCAAYSGSNGGGIIYITAGTATLHGTLTSAGNRRLEPKNTCVKTVGGPGSGGTIYLQATTLNLDDTRVFNVSGGDRVLVYNNLFSGKGGNGRVRVDYDTMNGYSHLTASAKSIETSFPGVGFWGRVPPG